MDLRWFSMLLVMGNVISHRYVHAQCYQPNACFGGSTCNLLYDAPGSSALIASTDNKIMCNGELASWHFDLQALPPHIELVVFRPVNIATNTYTIIGITNIPGTSLAIGFNDYTIPEGSRIEVVPDDVLGFVHCDANDFCGRIFSVSYMDSAENYKLLQISVGVTDGAEITFPITLTSTFYISATILPACQPGEFSSTSCTPCEPGTYQPEAGIITSCIECEPGTSQSDSRATACVECEPGTYQPDSGEAACIECKPGSFNPNTTACIECERGTYQPNTGRTPSCLSCEKGYSQPRRGSTSCLLCIPGTYAANDGSAICLPCSRGTFQDNSGATECGLCDIGFYQDSEAKISCIPCDDGMSTVTTGTDSANLCLPYCQPGEWSSTGLTPCNPCEPGTFQSSPGSTDCEPCPSGAHQPDSNQASCIPCKPGSYQPDTGATECTPCQKGYYQDDEGAADCIRCPSTPDMTTTASTGSISTDCKVCQYVDDMTELDNDRDGEGDECDEDDDNDGVRDQNDGCPLVVDPDQLDKDRDGIGDKCDNCLNDINPDQSDTDQDGVGDECDNCRDMPNHNQKNFDKDLYGDVCDDCPNKRDNDIGNGLTDVDNDGYWNGCDNCPLIPNPDQTDSDLDDIGDACDNCPRKRNFFQTDTNQNGIGDVCEPSVPSDDQEEPPSSQTQTEDSDRTVTFIVLGTFGVFVLIICGGVCIVVVQRTNAASTVPAIGQRAAQYRPYNNGGPVNFVPRPTF